MLAHRVLGRQRHGGTIHERPFVAEFCCEGHCSGTLLNNPTQTGTPAFAAQYCKVYDNCKLLAVADEEGFVSIVNTGKELPTEMADDWTPNRPAAQWRAHFNAVFDVAWCNGDHHMLTASGDQTVALWDTGSAEQLALFQGHTGSVKGVAPMPETNSVFASGARDGALMVWDARVAPAAQLHAPVITIEGAHAPSEQAQQRRRRSMPLQGRTRPSVTCLTFLQGGSQLASGGVDGIVKFWDLRHAEAGATAEAAPAMHLDRLCDAAIPHISQKQQHGITSLALHPQGSQLLVSMMGGHHFVFDPLRPNIGPVRWFGGHTVASFYVKAGWSPDGTHIISGSTDRNVHIWQVDAPDGASPYVLPGHQGEVTAVAWCPTDFHQIATTADDATLKVWSIQRRQPEEAKEQADGGARGQAWGWASPRWQRHAHQAPVQAGAAAPAADAAQEMEAVGGAVDVAQGAATPGGALAASPATHSVGQDTPVPCVGRGTLGGQSVAGGSASLLAALRGGLSEDQLGAAGAQGGGADENSHANLRQQQQQVEPSTVQQQQNQQFGSAGVVGSSAGTAGRGTPHFTPFAAGAAAAAVAAAGATTPAAATALAGSSAPRTAGTAAGSGRRVRGIGDILQAAPNSHRALQQTSITAFMPSPAAAMAAAGSCPGRGTGVGPNSALAAGRGTASRRGGRDLPHSGVAPGSVGGSAAISGGKRAAGEGSAPHQASLQQLALPGLGGSGLPNHRAKRRRGSFEPSRGHPAAAANTSAGRCGGAGPGTATTQRQQQREGAAAAAQLDPSRELAAKAAAAIAAAAQGQLGGASLERQLSSQENVEPMQAS